MSATRSRGLPATPRAGLPVIVLVLLVSVATVAGVIVTDGNPAAALAPVGAVAVLYLLANMPLRYPALALLFFGLVLESPGEIFASGKFKSPLYPVGWLLLAHWNVLLPVKPLIFSGVDLILVLIFTLAWIRRTTRSRIDGPGFVETPSPMRYFAWVTMGSAFLLELWGVARGDMDFGNSLWQVEHVVYLPLFFFAFDLSFRGPCDQRSIGKVIIAAATLRAAIAWAIRHFVKPNSIDVMPVATTHTDSMLFAGAFCLCVALVLETPNAKNELLCLIVLPILSLGMLANNRRIAWVEIALALSVMFVIMPMTPLKRRIIRWTLAAIPLFALYLAIGWGQTGGIFRAAATIRSLVDSKSDASTEWRDLENLDLIVSLKSSPLLGLGYGHRYIGPVDIEDVYPQEHFLPHNSLLGVWAFGGIIGFWLNWTFLAVGAFIAARSYRKATRALDRVAALGTLMMLMIYMNHCYGDLGLGTTTGVLLVAVALSVVGKIGLTTGAWPAKIPPPARHAMATAQESLSP